MEYSNMLSSLVKQVRNAPMEFPTRAYVKHSRGIITASENTTRLFQSLISINILRTSGCTLPIELFYADESELTEENIRLLETLHVTCINIQSVSLFENYNAKNFSIKALALYLSSFDETIWIDADIIPLINFDRLFDIAAYKAHHHLFFEDIFSYDKKENGMTQTTKLVYERLGVTLEKGTPETDSGMFMFHKSKLHPTCISFIVSLNCSQRLLYKLVYGDKELYRLAIMMVNTTFCSNELTPRCIGKYFEKEKLMCGNAVILETIDFPNIAIHMTLHSVDHMFTYSDFWRFSFWTHWITKPIEVDLRMVEPINQEIIPRYEYDYKFVSTIPETIETVQTEMYMLASKFQNLLNPR